MLLAVWRAGASRKEKASTVQEAAPQSTSASTAMPTAGQQLGL